MRNRLDPSNAEIVLLCLLDSHTYKNIYSHLWETPLYGGYYENSPARCCAALLAELKTTRSR